MQIKKSCDKKCGCKKEAKKPKYEKGVDHVTEFYKNLKK